MKKFIFNILIFFAIVSGIDVIAGITCNYLESHAKGGDTYREYYAFMKSNENILIYGSSRAIHHYIPKLITDSTKQTCFNCGLDGNGIIFQYGRYKVMTNRYTPDIIIYDIEPAFDLNKDDKLKYLNGLKAFYDEPGVDSIFWDVSYIERYKMFSKLYRYNTKFIQMASDNIRPLQKISKGGYKPLYGEIDYNIEWSDDPEYEIDTLKLKYFESMILSTKERGIKLIFVASPKYRALSSDSMTPIKQLCNKYDIQFLDYYCDNRFVNNASLFQDSHHLNDNGASRFTNILIDTLKVIIKPQQKS